MEAERGMLGAQASGGSTGARARNPWGQGERLRTEILTAAAELLGELGTVEGLTLRGVARRAGVAPASIYTQFADRAALIDALLCFEHERVSELMRQAGTTADPADPAGEVRSQLYAFCRFSLAHPGYYRVMFGPHAERRTPMLRALVEQLTTALTACERSGARLRLPADRAAIVLLVGSHGRVAISHAQPEVTDEKPVLRFVDELVGLVFGPD